MSRRNKDGNYNIHFDLPVFAPMSGKIRLFLDVFLVFIGVFSWFAVFLFKRDMVHLTAAEAVVSLVVLLINIYLILRVGYDGFRVNLRMSWMIHTILSVIVFYLTGINRWILTVMENHALAHFLRFIGTMVMALFLALLPVFLICSIIWLIMVLFGEDA